VLPFFFVFKFSAARDLLAADQIENISAAKIQDYIQTISGKSDWSVRGWQEWAALEKYLKPEAVTFLQEVCFISPLLQRLPQILTVCACLCAWV